MKQGRTLQEFAAELQRQSTERKDYIVDQKAVDVRVVEGEVVLDGLNGDAKPINEYAHGQIAQYLDIPTAYYRRMRQEQPELLADNIRTWLHAEKRAEDGNDNVEAKKRMIRTLDNRVRAFLSPKYRPLDNYELVEQAIFPAFEASDGKLTIASQELTETRLYIKVLVDDLTDQLPAGMTWGEGHNMVAQPRGRVYGADGKLVSALTISNSDLGNGSLRIEPAVFTTWCTNLAIMTSAAMRKYHVGKAFEANEDFTIYRDETREAADKAFWMKVRDTIMTAFDRKRFEAAVASIRRAAETPIVSVEALPTVVEVAVKQLALPERTSTGILAALAKGGDFSKWGLSSAITEVANTEKDYEVATELERAGGKVLELVGRNWKAIAEAKPEEEAA